MSISQVRATPSYQPFQCLVCQSRFTRHENLKRHSTLHSRSQAEASLPCNFCHATFSRPGLRNRHMKRKHPEHEQHRVMKRTQCQPAPRRDKLDSSVSPTAVSPTGSHGGFPYPGSLHLSPGDEMRFGSDAIWRPVVQYSSSSSLTLQQQSTTNDSVLIDQIAQDASDLERNLLLGTSFLRPTDHLDNQLHPILTAQAEPVDTSLAEYCFNTQFWIVSHFLPFLHSSTFDPTQAAPHLVLSILCLAYQYGEDPECGDQEGSGESFSIRCFHKARALLASDEERSDASTMITTLVQSYLLLQICAMMYLCGDSSACGLKMHSHMISLARAGQMKQPMTVESAATADLESLWREFVKAESHKRTLFAVHQIDALWYQFLSIPRSISHLEIKHNMPCPEEEWSSSFAAECDNLLQEMPAPQSHTPMLFDASFPLIRIPSPFRHLTPYGAINIAQFLISSTREISGWATMTRMLSMERFGALRSSLIALSPFICPGDHITQTKHATSCAATWETAMIELQIWSPSHTGGIVEGSIDAVLSHSTYIGSSQFLCDTDTAKAIPPHVNWFLRYLDETLVLGSEAPWVTLYAYKAFLIAWQLIHVGLPGAMDTVGVHDGDEEGALIWARKVFQRRRKWQLGKLILSCLDELDK
ncbi:unnamed protein product [Penicillium egyptiacum]|uniref:C2H2-type domain-containing protein n=1 Tax=Penicillium egyptiacum TaxID=1303716 RepID=A0A9W4KB70_9EURO|nr:unnamed protein product [Penicillium egyptiacum]